MIFSEMRSECWESIHLTRILAPSIFFNNLLIIIPRNESRRKWITRPPTNGIEQQLVNVRKSFEKYTEAVHSKLHTVHEDLISRWEEESPVSGKSVTLADNWEWERPKRYKPFCNQYYAQSFKLENPGSGDMGRVITCEFFFNIEFNDEYVSSDPEYGSFNTIWYKAYWGGHGTTQKPKVRITKPYHKILDAKLEDSNETIKNAVEEAIERTLKTCWNI